MTVKAVIFDVDGTLADTEEIHRLSFNASFRHFGLDWQWEPSLYRRLLKVAGGKERIRHYCARFQPDSLARPDAEATIQGLHREKTRRYTDCVDNGGLEPRPGVLRLIRELRGEGIRLAIATTTTRANVDALLRGSFPELPADTFEVIAAGEDAPDKKPSPAVYHRVLERLGLPPQACIAVEDSKNGVAAARAAGIDVLVTECVWTTGEDFSGAVAVVSDLGEPERPHALVSGPAFERGYVDAAALRRIKSGP